MTKFTEIMNKISFYYKSSGKIYENHSPIYGNDVPIYRSKSALKYILDVSPETYEYIANFNDIAIDCIKKKILFDSLDEIMQNCPEDIVDGIEYIKEWLKSLL